ncbi:hypothetical protein ES703_53618 [subsurface metagenome]
MAMRIRKIAGCMTLRARGMVEIRNLYPVCISDICHE